MSWFWKLLWNWLKKDKKQSRISLRKRFTVKSFWFVIESRKWVFEWKLKDEFY